MFKQVDVRRYLFLAALVLTGLARAADVSSLVASHNALHETEHLVSSGQVDPGFLTKLQRLHIETLAHERASDPAFRVTLEQYAGADGTKKSVEWLIGANGKAVSFTAQEGSEAEGAPAWQGKSPIARIEQAQHGLLHAAGSDPKLAPFVGSLSEIAISQVTDSSGKVVGQVDFLSRESSTLYRALVDDSGKVVSAGPVSE